MVTGALVGTAAALVVVACAAHLARIARRAPGPALEQSRRAHRPTLVVRRRERLLDDAYPDALDLFVVSVQSGQLPAEALVGIAPHVHPLIEAAIHDVVRGMDRGQRFVDALDALVDALGPRALSFVATVALAERTGLAIAPMIDRIADDARTHRRRRAEAAARELPVRLTFPLVLCTLPSFVLVAIAPLLIGALSSLRGV